jgi:hypothetical protein
VEIKHTTARKPGLSYIIQTPWAILCRNLPRRPRLEVIVELLNGNSWKIGFGVGYLNINVKLQQLSRGTEE